MGIIDPEVATVPFENGVSTLGSIFLLLTAFLIVAQVLDAWSSIRFEVFNPANKFLSLPDLSCLLISDHN